MEAILAELSKHPVLVFSIFSISLLVVNLAGFRLKGALTFIALILLVVSFLFVALVYKPEPAPFSTMVALLFLYGTGLFVFLSELLLGRIGKLLTRMRGEKWTKELDYVYLSMGVIGILFSLNKIDFITGRFEGTDIIAPLLLTTAIVIRFIRTRAEIGQWNKIT
jgi:hypothetical protein